jgi:hypothetical protein
MEIEYEFTVDDAQAYTRYYVNNSPVFKKQLDSTRKKLLYIPVIFLLGALIISFGGNRVVPVIFVLMAAFVFGFYFFMPSLVKNRVLKTTLEHQKQLFHGNKRKQKLTVTADNFSQTTPESASTFQWTMVESILTLEQYLFIVVRGFGTVGVPARAFPSKESFQQFAGEVKANYQAAKSKS